MPKRPPLPAPWEWFCQIAQSQGIDPNVVSLPQATEVLVARLERCRKESQPLDGPAFELAAVLVHMIGSLAIGGLEPTWKNAEPLIIRALTRRTARFLTKQLENAGFTRPLPQPTPEPIPEEPEVTLYDLVQTLRIAMGKLNTLAEKRRSASSEQA
jgi:chromatin segregation and condensation protein Rec8/ScpA/Scc1 (kleisin family)